jgi:type IV secretion system protein VirB9
MRHLPLAVLALHACAVVAQAVPIAEVDYDRFRVIHVPVARGVPTHVELEAGEVLNTVAPGVNANCEDENATWCIQWQEGGSHILAKPLSGSGPNNAVEVITNRRSISLQFDVSAKPARRVILRTPPLPVDPRAQMTAAAMALLPQPEEVLEQRLNARPLVRNASYSLAVGKGSDDIVPKAIFDDARSTFLEYPGNRPVPAVFQRMPDGTEQFITTRMDPRHNLLVVPVVARALVLRSGGAVVELRNDAFDLDGRGPEGGAVANGVQRLTRNPKTGQMEALP